MKKAVKRLASLALAVLLSVQLAPVRGQAVLDGVYFTAANEQLLEMNAATMPFWSWEEILYVPVSMFQGTDLGIFYVFNNSLQTAVLYTTKTDLRFDLPNQTCISKEGKVYDAFAIEKNGQIFVPVDLVCYHFGLDYNLTETELVPLLRVVSPSSVLDDISFIDAALNQMRDRYSRYEAWSNQQQPPVVRPPEPPVVEAGQKLHLLLPCEDAQTVMSLLPVLERCEAQITALLPVEQLENGDLVRGLLAGGHSIALLARGADESEVEAEVEQARALLWQAGCSWLQMVWYEGEEDLSGLLQDLGCVPLQADLDQRAAVLEQGSRVQSLLTEIRMQGAGAVVCLNGDPGSAEGLTDLLEGLAKDKYNVCIRRIAG